MLAAQHIDDSKLLDLRNRFRSGSFDAPAFVRALQARSPEAAKARAEELLLAMQVGAKVAKSATDAEWLSFARHGTLPNIVPLTPAEMAAAQGGVSPIWGALGFFIVVAICLL